ncbi:acetylcholinesterase-like [Asterias rubens]|uniref:acetylcholinesterase-like n=1 Tax=Asterias rubens TaxID=7604 RepID=UPI001455095A|nr:acetylcholinesterase-like [Asterias rubens]
MAAVFYFLLGFVQLCVAAFYNGHTEVVSTMAGDVVGAEGAIDGEAYRVFKGIPYAEPPVGPLRFSDPVPKSSWGGVFNATSFGPSCPQSKPAVDGFNPEYVVTIPDGGWEIGEDCLTLNVYTPLGNMTQSGLAVMVWLHGGGYQHGQGSAYDVSVLTTKGGVVVVTINYRLGPFGFLFTGDDGAKGNYGLKDQRLALKWVKENIMAFGGDPERVTLFSQSDVLESIPLHLMADDSRSLFHRMAVHSPNWNTEFSDESNVEGLAGYLNCSSDNTSLLMDCLRSKSMEEILDAGMGGYDVWRPVLNDDFFGAKSKDGITHDFLSVFNTGDGSIGLDLLKKSLHSDGEDYNLTSGVTEEQFGEWLRSYTDDSGVSKLAIEEHYISNDFADENFARMQALVDIHLDTNSIRYHSKRLDDLDKMLSSIFMMVFDHRSSVDWEYPEIELVPHGGEMSYVLGLPFIAPGDGRTFTSEEQALSQRMIEFWSNFAKTGNPNSDTTDPPSNLTGPIWPEYGDTKEYLQVRLNSEEVGSDYRGEEALFWNEYLPELNEAARESCPTEEATERTPSSPEWTPEPTDGKDPTPTGMCGEKPVIGKSLGLELSPAQAESLIGTMIFVSVGLLCVIVMVFGALLGYKFKSKRGNPDQKAELSVEKGAAPQNGYELTNKNHVNSVNESGPQEGVYENMQAPAAVVLSTEIYHKPDLHDSEEDDEAESLQEKRPIPDSDEEEIPPHYASVDRSTRPTEDDADSVNEEVTFPPPPGDWISKSPLALVEPVGDEVDPDTTEEKSPSRSDEGSVVSDPPTEPDEENTRM